MLLSLEILFFFLTKVKKRKTEHIHCMQLCKTWNIKLNLSYFHFLFCIFFMKLLNTTIITVVSNVFLFLIWWEFACWQVKKLYKGSYSFHSCGSDQKEKTRVTSLDSFIEVSKVLVPSFSLVKRFRTSSAISLSRGKTLSWCQWVFYWTWICEHGQHGLEFFPLLPQHPYSCHGNTWKFP